MKRKLMLALSAAIAAQAVAGFAQAGTEKQSISSDVTELGAVPVEKSAAASTVGARGYVDGSHTIFGGFEVNQATTIYILVRGNSLGALGITQAYLDAPHVRVYNASGQDLITQAGYAGFNDCLSANTATDLPIINYYAARGIPVQSRDTCYAGFFNPGAYTFSVTPSFQNANSALRNSGNGGPAVGEVLFEVKLGP